MKKKAFLGMFLIGILGASMAFAAPNKDRTVPYPKGITLPTKEGATSAPKEINHGTEYFEHPDFFKMKSSKTRTILSHYPTYQQTTEYTCGPAAALTVLWYYGNHDFDEMSLAKGMRTKPYPIGSNPKDMAYYLKTIGWHVESSLESKPFADYKAFQEFVLKNLKKDRPILVENVEWGGHWRVIIGYDDMGTKSPLDDTLIFMDSYDTCDHKQDGYTVQNGEKFFSMWFDHSMLPENQRNQPWIVVYP